MTGYDRFRRVAMGSDHAGFDLKEAIKAFLKEKGFEIADFEPQPKERINFHESAIEVATAAKGSDDTLGILVCGTGVGMCALANRFRGVHASILYDDLTAEYSRRHSNSNVLVFGGRTMKIEEALSRLQIFLSNEFEGGRYAERNSVLDRYGSSE